jgi:hypothetical protein
MDTRFRLRDTLELSLAVKVLMGAPVGRMTKAGLTLQNDGCSWRLIHRATMVTADVHDIREDIGVISQWIGRQ